MTEAQISEREARNRIEVIIHYVKASVRHAIDNFDLASSHRTRDDDVIQAEQNGFCALSMAEEYLQELAKLEERPFSCKQESERLQTETN